MLRPAARLFALVALLGLAPFPASAAEPPAEPASDPRVAWLAANAIPLRSLDPADDDFSDLEPLRRVLDGVEMVLLGEQSHGDGTTFLAKGRLIRFLHQEMGFDVLAFESGLYDVDKAWRLAVAGEDEAFVPTLGQGIFGIWTRSEQVQPALEYVASQASGDRPLEVTGFDSQFTGRASREHFVADLTAQARRHGLPIVDSPDWPKMIEVIGHMTQAAYAAQQVEKPPKAEQKAFRKRLDKLRRQWEERAPKGDRETAFWLQVLESLRTHSRSVWEADRSQGMPAPEIFELRDLQMGENLVWLARERFQGRKILVWAATFHNARNLASIQSSMPGLKELYSKIRVAGDGVYRELGAKAYSLGFTAYEGEAGSVFGKPRPLQEVEEGSLEDLAARAGLENAWIDLRSPGGGGAWLRQPLSGRPLGYAPMTANWGAVVDGMLFTRQMEPSRRAERTRLEWVRHEVPLEDTLHNGTFVGADHGWLITHRSGKVLRTEDGGQTWKVVAQLGEGFLETIHFRDRENGWLCGDGGRLWKTEDGGESWRRVGNFPPSQAFYTVHFFDERRGFVGGVETQPFGQALWTTKDGGATWTERSAELAGGPTTDSLQTLPDGRTVVAGFSRLLATADQGASWKALEVENGLRIRGLYFQDARRGWVVGQDGRLQATEDGGSTWQARPPLAAGLLRGIHFVDELRGFAAGDPKAEGPTLWATVDGGKTWEGLDLTGKAMHRLVVSERLLWALGEDGEIFYLILP